MRTIADRLTTLFGESVPRGDDPRTHASTCIDCGRVRARSDRSQTMWHMGNTKERTNVAMNSNLRTGMKQSNEVTSKGAYSNSEHNAGDDNILQDGKDRLLRVKEAADTLAISVRAFYRLIADGQLPAPVKIERATRIPASDLQRTSMV